MAEPDENTAVPVMDKLLEIPFKGGRDYIHGTDIYNTVLAEVAGHLSPVGQHQFIFHRLARSRCRLVMLASEKMLARQQTAVTEFSFVTPSGYLLGWLEETGEPVLTERAYEENRITARCAIAGNRVGFHGDTGFTPIEVIVAVNKHLHQTLFKEQKLKWVFTKLELQGPLPAEIASDVEIELVHRFGSRLTKSEVVHSGVRVGWIYFSAL